VQKILDPEGARHARDALAKSVYGKLFLWIVNKANETIHSDQYASSIGVLDIFGFEILGKNGFEQLCINYTNEKLHQLFIEQTLRGEQQVYKDEGIKWEPVAFFDNKPIIDLVERNGGMFALINEESIFPKGSDQSLHSKLKSQLRDKEFTTPAKGTASEFQLKHYAGSVNYDTAGMLDRNKDHLFADMIVLAQSSNNAVAAQLFKDSEEVSTAKSANTRATTRPETTCIQYKKSVSSLMEDLKKTNLHYIRCIKPNDQKQASIFQSQLVDAQALYLGLLENVKVRRAGYAFRMPYDRFVAKFVLLLLLFKSQCLALINTLRPFTQIQGHHSRPRRVLVRYAIGKPDHCQSCGH